MDDILTITIFFFYGIGSCRSKVFFQNKNVHLDFITNNNVRINIMFGLLQDYTYKCNLFFTNIQNILHFFIFAYKVNDPNTDIGIKKCRGSGSDIFTSLGFKKIKNLVYVY